MIPPLHVVTDDDVVARPDFVAVARAVLAAGGRRLALHLRAPAAPAARLFALAAELLESARAAGARVLANDRVDLALAAGLDGVHLRERSLPPDVVRTLLPPPALLGCSVHDEAGARSAFPHVDYLVVGTIFATASHPGRAPRGPELVRRLAAVVPAPLVAIGGITPERVPELRASGAVGVAVVSGVWGRGDPGEAVRGYLEVL